MADIIRLEGMPELQRALKEAPNEIAVALKQAGEESADEILNTQGLRSYPPHTQANLPPTPYYIRNRGMQYNTRNLNNSERYGTKWTVKTTSHGTTIGNSASYAPYLGGEKQASHMADIGWRRLLDVAMEKLGRINDIYKGWIVRALRKAGL